MFLLIQTGFTVDANSSLLVTQTQSSAYTTDWHFGNNNGLPNDPYLQVNGQVTFAPHTLTSPHPVWWITNFATTVNGSITIINSTLRFQFDVRGVLIHTPGSIQVQGLLKNHFSFFASISARQLNGNVFEGK